MLRKLVVAGIITGAVSVIGCSNESGGIFSKAGDTETAQLAAYAANTQYPNNAQPSNDLRIASVLNQDGGRLRIYNFTNQSLNNVNVWVNGAFVKRVDSVPPNGSVSLSFASFYDNHGNNLAKFDAAVTKVQLQVGDKLYDAEGPARE